MPLVVFSIAVFCILFVLFINLIINLSLFYRLRPGTNGNTVRNPRADQTVSILVPARNEADHIEECVRSLVGQHYEQLEVLVLDDQSTDTTAEVVLHVIDELPPEQQGRLRLLRGEPLPSGWIGKNFACYQLAQHALGDYLLFADADAIHAPETARAVIDCMDKLDVQMLTAQPQYLLQGSGERLVVPLLSFKVFTLLPVELVRRRPERILTVANGPLLCFSRSVYEAIGGHRAVKESILEDITLARTVKAAGYRVAYVDGMDMVRCYMYDSFEDMWVGFSRNFFSYYSYSLPAACAIFVYNLALFVVPPLLVLAAPFIALPPLGVLFACGSYALALLMRMLLVLRFTRSHRLLMLFLCLLHPVSIVLECLILLNSIRWHYRKMGTLWKGRYYNTIAAHHLL
jgi:chlorobactene glucosyltransferase